MPNIKIIQTTLDEKLTCWKKSEINREDVLYFLTEELNEKDIEKIAWELGLIIKIETIGFLSKIIFIDILN